MTNTIFYSEEEMIYRDEARAFFEREVPHYIDAMERQNKYPFEMLKKMGEKHYIGVRFPLEYSGGGLDLIHETIVNEEVASQSYALACARSVAHHCAYIINNYGTVEQKRKYLPDIFTAKIIVAEAITEPTVGSDAARMKTRAVKENDHYIISGEKRFQAGITDPMKELDLAELHDAFTGTEIMAYEDCFFCEEGQGGILIDNGTVMPGGELPVNLSGGLIGCGHAVGATGIMQTYEVALHLRGEAGELQVKNARRGLVQSIGGTLCAWTVCLILERGK